MFAALRATDVLAAAERIAAYARRTPLVRNESLSAIAGGPVFLKLETEQPTGSFKLRGATNAVACLTDRERAAGIVASSAGNHGLGVAFAARAFGARATIFVPATAPAVKREGIAALGAVVDASSPTYDAAAAAARRFATEHGATFIDPCSGATLLAGQGTVALEIVSYLPSVATLALSVGGGGLAGGCASLLRRVAPRTRIVGAQSERTAAMTRSLAGGAVVAIEDEPTLADGLAGQIDDYGLDIGRHALDGIVTVAEDAIAETIAWLHRLEGVTAEGAGAAAVAAIRHRCLTGLRTPIAVIVSGGNIDADRLRAVLDEHPLTQPA